MISETANTMKYLKKKKNIEFFINLAFGAEFTNNTVLL